MICWRQIEGPRGDQGSPPRVWLKEYDDYTINYRVKFWIDDFGDLYEIEDDVMSRIWYHFKRNNIGLPYPISDVRVTPASVREPEEQRREEETAGRHLLSSRCRSSPPFPRRT